MATIKGVWKFKDSPNAGTVYSNGGFNYPFICSGVNYTGFSSNNRYYQTSGYPASAGYAHDLFYKTASSSVEVWHSYSTFAWKDEKYKTVDFGREEITVSDAFYAWITASAEYIPYAHDQSITEYKIKAATLVEIADSIRSKKGSSEPILTENMAGEISDISTAEPWDESFTIDKGAVITNTAIPLSVTENGTYTAPEGVTGYSPVTVNIETGVSECETEKFFDGTSEELIFPTIKKLKANVFQNYLMITVVRIPNVAKIEQFAFYFASNLTTIEMPKIEEIGTNSFYGCIKLSITELPEGLESVGEGSFRNCTAITGIVFPSTVKTIAASAFRNCSSLKAVTFLGTPESINASCFQDDTGIEVINVPWAEGAVANAPWGATNATINYNYGVV